MKLRSSARGFTLLEVLVATMIMAIAVVGLLSALATSMRNASHLTEHDRMALIARARMDEILANYDLPLEASFNGKFDAAATGDDEAGYSVAMGVFEAPENPGPGAPVLQRVVMRVWWKNGDKERSFNLEAFRRNHIPKGQPRV